MIEREIAGIAVMLRIVLSVLAIAACDGGGAAGDAAVTFDAGACEGGQPGVKVVFDPTGAVGPYSDSYLTVTVGAQVEQHAHVMMFDVDDAGVFSIGLPYPPGAASGPAAVDYYYAGPGVSDTTGHADFAADTAACVTATMTLENHLLGDASVDDAAP